MTLVLAPSPISRTGFSPAWFLYSLLSSSILVRSPFVWTWCDVIILRRVLLGQVFMLYKLVVHRISTIISAIDHGRSGTILFGTEAKRRNYRRFFLEKQDAMLLPFRINEVSGVFCKYSVCSVRSSFSCWEIKRGLWDRYYRGRGFQHIFLHRHLVRESIPTNFSLPSFSPALESFCFFCFSIISWHQ